MSEGKKQNSKPKVHKAMHDAEGGRIYRYVACNFNALLSLKVWSETWAGVTCKRCLMKRKVRR